MAGSTKKAAPKKSSKGSKVSTKEIVVAAPKVPTNLGKSQKETVVYFFSTIKDPKALTLEEATDNFCNEMGPHILKYFAKTEKQLRSMFTYYLNETGIDKDIVFKAPEVTLNELEKPMLSEPVPYLAEKIDLENIDPELFVPLKTNTAFDRIASKRGGLMKGTVYILTGESGCGKTTIAVNIGDYLREVDPNITVGFISAEMDKTDWTEECFDNPRLAQIPTVFLLNYLDAPNYMEVLMQGLTGFKYVILDSFEVVIDQLKDRFGWTAKKAETELINILRQAASKGVTIIAIQQYTKGGNFVGSNKIKHLLTGMMFVMWDKDGDRFIWFTKNRRGGHMVKKKLYYTKNGTTGRLEFDSQKFETEQAAMNIRRSENAKLIEEQGLDPELIMRAQNLTETRNQHILLNSKDEGSGSIIPVASGNADLDEDEDN